MNPAQLVNWTAAFVLALSLIGTVGTVRAIDHLRRGAAVEELLYIRSPKALKRMCLGYSGLVADLYWTRAVQYFGYQHHEQSQDFHLLAPLLEMTIQLDPRSEERRVGKECRSQCGTSHE